MNKDAAYWRSFLKLEAHPEGGYFRETYRSPEKVPDGRSVATNIYYLLEQGDFSAFHRIKSDETWHFYAGGSLDLHVLNEGKHQQISIGDEVDLGEHLQYVVPAGTWFAAAPTASSAYSLVGCTVSPGFEFADFELASAQQLATEFPDLQQYISQFTRS